MKFATTMLTVFSFITFLSGCVTSLKTEIQNSPMASITGPKVFVETATPDGKPLITPFTDVIKDESYKFLAEKGFSRAKSKADAHTILWIAPGTRDREVDVPGQTFVIPVYQPGQQTNYNFMSSSGNYVSGTAQSQGTTQYQTGYREGYKAQIQDQWLQVEGLTQKNGEMPTFAFGGQVWRTSNDAEFFSNERALRTGVRKILGESMLNQVKRAPAADSKQRPGCRPMVGFEVDQEKAKDKEFLIKRIMPSSAAEVSGLKAGDEIKTMAGYSWPDFNADPQRVASIYRTGNVKVVVTRDGQEKEFSIKPKEICPD